MKGVGGVERVGGVSREIRITPLPDRLLALGITAAEVNKQVRVTSADMRAGAAKSAGASSRSGRWPPRAPSAT